MKFACSALLAASAALAPSASAGLITVGPGGTAAGYQYS